MGGCGSGRSGGKSTTDGMKALDVRKLKRWGSLTPGRSFTVTWSSRGKETGNINGRAETDRVILSYQTRSAGGEWRAMEYPVYLEWTTMHLGGLRPWFLCPALGCGRRVAILYGGAVFACRHCHRLAYACQRETGDGRAILRADAIRERLKWVPGIANGNGGKPKGMHWKTYYRLRAAHDGFVHSSLMGSAQRFGFTM